LFTRNSLSDRDTTLGEVRDFRHGQRKPPASTPLI
jgi:hypothetical protein